MNIKLIIIGIVAIIAVAILVSSVGYTATVAEVTGPEGRYYLNVKGEAHRCYEPIGGAWCFVKRTTTDWGLETAEDVEWFNLQNFFFGLFETSEIKVKLTLEQDDIALYDESQGLGNYGAYWCDSKKFDITIEHIKPSEESYDLYITIYEGNKECSREFHSSIYMPPKAGV